MKKYVYSEQKGAGHDSLVRSDPDKDHSEEDQAEVDDFCPEIALLEDDDSACERNYHRAAAHQRHYGNHR